MENKKKHHNSHTSPKEIMEKLNTVYGKNPAQNIPINDNNCEEKNMDSGEINGINQRCDSLETVNQELNATIEELLNEKNELEEQLRRRMAEFENFKRRTDKEKSDLLEYGVAKLLVKCIDLLDDIKNAEQAANSTDNIASVQKGLGIISQKTAKLFEEEGVKQMDTKIGDDFDVNLHEALMRQPSELPENKIVMILQNGYFYKDKVLRYAKVATSAGDN